MLGTCVGYLWQTGTLYRVNAHTELQLQVIRSVNTTLASRSIRWWLFGGWALDALLGEVTRDHGDIEFWVERKDAIAVLDALTAVGAIPTETQPIEESREYTSPHSVWWLGVAGRGRGDDMVGVGCGVSVRRGAACAAVVVLASVWCVTPASAAAGGTKLWVAKYTGGFGPAVSTAASPDGSRLYVTGYSDAGSGERNNFVTIAYNPTTGAQLWLASYNSGLPNRFDDLCPGAGGEPGRHQGVRHGGVRR